ncbi:hypothetical protein Hanom_Chr08g00691691 [Helianthus anomalus]
MQSFIIFSAASASSLLSFINRSTSAFGNLNFTLNGSTPPPPPPFSTIIPEDFINVKSEADLRANFRLSSRSFALMLIPDRTLLVGTFSSASLGISTKK